MTIERLLEAGRALEGGQLDRAEHIYRQVAEADPRSSIAVVGLAHVALLRGERDAALRLAQSALAIDPRNAAARRLVEGGAGGQGRRSGAPGVAVGPGRGAERPEPNSTDRSSLAEPADPAPDAEWPWPDLEEQLARYRKPAPGLLGRLLGRGRR
jgi:hypothetical protein